MIHEVNDVQSQPNQTRVKSVLRPCDEAEIQTVVRDAKKAGDSISVAGGRHAMGGQQFATDSVLLDMTQCARVLHFDRQAGRIEVESGIMWPSLIATLHKLQPKHQATSEGPIWAIRQKQTGVDKVSIGGSLASNIHGRGLSFPPFISDIESFRLVDHTGKVLHCSREENPELFSLAIGGYGLFGIVSQVTLRLVPRQIVKRMVEIIAVKHLLSRVEAAIEEGYLFGDCQYSINLEGDEEFHPGVFSCYKPMPKDTVVPEDGRKMSASDWASMYQLARSDKARAFSQYGQYYLQTSGQVYHSDAHQLSNVFEGYSEAMTATNAPPEIDKATEMISEVYVSKEAFIPFMIQVRRDFIQHNVDMTYGTIRFIEPDTESFLPWAKQASVCIVCNLHVVHTEKGIKKAKADFQRVIDRVIEHHGSFFLTYHRWARRDQVEACYPRFAEFLAAKRRYDPDGVFQSEWYRHYADLFASSD